MKQPALASEVCLGQAAYGDSMCRVPNSLTIVPETFRGRRSRPRPSIRKCSHRDERYSDDGGHGDVLRERPRALLNARAPNCRPRMKGTASTVAL
jgi:hypothetical protein